MPNDRPIRLARRSLVRLGAGGAVLLAAPATIGRAQPATLRIGHIQPLTGPSAPYGIRGRDGAQLALDEVNANGVQVGGTTYRLEIKLDDMANDARQAIILMRQNASDPGILACLAPTNSVGYVPLVPVAGQVQLVLMGTGAGAPIKEWNPYAYRVNAVSTSAVPIMLKKVVAKEKVKRLAVIYDQTQDGQKGDADVARAMAGELGYEVVAFEAFRAGDQDVSPQAATIRSNRPDAIYLAAATGDGVRVASQLREAGLKQPMMTGFGSFQDPIYWDGTQGQIRGCYTWLGQDLSSPGGQLKSFLDKYKARFPQEATSFSAFAADAVTAIVTALQKAGSPDRAKLQEAMAALQVTTPIGSAIQFRNPPTGENLTPSVVVVRITGRGTYATE